MNNKTKKRFDNQVIKTTILKLFKLGYDKIGILLKYVEKKQRQKS